MALSRTPRAPLTPLALLPFLLSLLPVLLSVLPAQEDIIEWTDGTSTRGVKVESFTAKEITFKVGSRSESRPADQVFKVKIKAWTEAYRLVDKLDPESFFGEAQDLSKKKKSFEAQHGYWQAALLYLKDGKIMEAVSALKTLDELHPESAYSPQYYIVRLQYYLSEKKVKDATVVAEDYGKVALQRGWSRGYERDAEYYVLSARALGGKVQLAEYIRSLIELRNKTDGHLAQRIAADLGVAYLRQKDPDSAKKIFEELAELKGLEVNVHARMLLGRGYIHLEKAQATNDKEAYYQAFRYFLRVYTNAKDADPELVAEGLYNAAKAVEKWNGLPTCNWMGAILRGRLKRREPYMSTSWAKK